MCYTRDSRWFDLELLRSPNSTIRPINQWRRTASLLQGMAGAPGRSAAGNGIFGNGVICVLRSGAHRHDLLPRYGGWKSWYTCITVRQSGVWGGSSRRQSPIHATSISCSTSSWSSPINAQRPETAGKRFRCGRSRRNLTARIHMLANALGRPCASPCRPERYTLRPQSLPRPQLHPTRCTRHLDALHVASAWRARRLGSISAALSDPGQIRSACRETE